MYVVVAAADTLEERERERREGGGGGGERPVWFLLLSFSPTRHTLAHVGPWTGSQQDPNVWSALARDSQVPHESGASGGTRPDF